MYSMKGLTMAGLVNRAQHTNLVNNMERACSSVSLSAAPHMLAEHGEHSGMLGVACSHDSRMRYTSSAQENL